MLIIGAPVLRREWIINEWKKHVIAAVPEGMPYGFVFVGGKGDPTFDAFDSSDRISIRYIEEDRAEDHRTWNIDRYERMAYLRNELLDEVRSYEPDYFLSLDTDILLHPDGIKTLLETIVEADAVGGKCYLSERGRNCPSYAYISAGRGLRRADSQNVLMPDVIMAIKLMTPKAYNVDYTSNKWGEDIGWSLAAKGSGLSLAWDGRITNKHVMRPELLSKVDYRAGF
jgi:hypothetical protein